MFLCLLGLGALRIEISVCLFRLGVGVLCGWGASMLFVIVVFLCLWGLCGFLTVIVICLLRFGVVVMVGVCVFDASVLVFWCSSSEVQSESDVL